MYILFYSLLLCRTIQIHTLFTYMHTYIHIRTYENTYQINIIIKSMDRNLKEISGDDSPLRQVHILSIYPFTHVRTYN